MVWNGALRARDQHCEHPLTFVQNLRLIADGELGATEGFRSDHGDLEAALGSS
jgi:hypothetical protein